MKKIILLTLILVLTLGITLKAQNTQVNVSGKNFLSENIQNNTLQKGDFALSKTNDNSTTIQLTNSLGEILMEEKTTSQHLSFNIQNFSSVIYFATITQNNSVKRVKIIKE